MQEIVQPKLCPCCAKAPATTSAGEIHCACGLRAPNILIWNTRAPMAPSWSALADRIKMALSGEIELTGEPCKHGWDRAVCAMKGCGNPYDVDTLLMESEAALRLAAKPADDGVREACAKLADDAADVEDEKFDAADRDHALSDTGRLAVLDRALARKSMAQQLALSIRALSTKAPKP